MVLKNDGKNKVLQRTRDCQKGESPSFGWKGKPSAIITKGGYRKGKSQKKVGMGYGEELGGWSRGNKSGATGESKGKGEDYLKGKGGG